VLFAELVLRRIGIGVAPLPEVLDERLAFLVVAQAHERFAFIVGDDVGNFLVQPGLVGPLQLLPQFPLSLVPLLIGELAIQGIGLLALAGCRCRLGLAGGGRRVVLLRYEPAAGTQTREQPRAVKRRWRLLNIIAFETPAISSFYSYFSRRARLSL
jgi:hypothetical protein